MELPDLTPRVHPLGTVLIRLAVPKDRLYIDALQRKYVNNVGFVPRTAIDDHLDRHSYKLITINAQPIGYSMASGGVRKPLRLIQVALSDEAWRNGLGTLLIEEALRRGEKNVKTGMTATIRDGLPMNQVVTATGATLVGRDTTPTARGRTRFRYHWDSVLIPRDADALGPLSRCVLHRSSAGPPFVCP